MELKPKLKTKGTKLMSEKGDSKMAALSAPMSGRFSVSLLGGFLF